MAENYRMKILLVGQFQAWSLECHYQRYLSEYAEVFTYAAEDIFDEYYHPSLLNKVKVKMGFSKIYNRIADGLLAKVEEVQPDVVWVFKGMRVLPKVLKAIKKKNIILANYNPDHPFFFSGKGSGNANVTNSIDLFDLHFCYDNRVSERIEREYGIRTALLPFAFELSSELCEKLNNLEEIKAACFIGTCDDIRVEHVSELAKTGVPIHVYGNNWDQAVPEGETSITAFPAVYNEEFWEKMRAYRLQLNIFRPHNIGSHNMRTFEVPAVGGIMLAPDSPDHHLFFEPRKEIFLYRNKTEMITKAQEIMALSETEALQIRNAARARSLASKYTYEHRAMTAFQAFQQMMELV